MMFPGFLKEFATSVGGELDRLLPAENRHPQTLHRAMRYSIFAGGKRVRPALVAAAGETYGASLAALLPGAAAIEMIHTFSLVHDDLPGLDDDDLRRGVPTVHRKFDEATAVLVGDALLNLGLQVLATQPTRLDASVRARAVGLVAEAVGAGGMIGGQMSDIESERAWPADAESMLEWIHGHKTGALIVASLRLGGLYAGVGEEEDRRLRELGERIGLMFQIADDILDVEGSAHALGKAAQKDNAARKLTYPALHGLEASRDFLWNLHDEAREIAGSLPAGGALFVSLADYLARRDR